ncbi:MAG: hypothetical protein RLZZ203_1453 [Cyanobacteriota bacterium]|jgi:hypothetical protein
MSYLDWLNSANLQRDCIIKNPEIKVVQARCLHPIPI